MASDMRIGRLARRAGVSATAIRFYEARGLLGPAERTAAGYRLYGEDALQRLGFIRRAKLLELSLEEVRELLDSSGSGAGEGMRHLLAHKLVAIRRRRAELAALERTIEALYLSLPRADCNCRHLDPCNCPSRQPLPEEIEAMSHETATIEQGTCTCDATCATADTGCTCQCTCCSEEGREQSPAATPVQPVLVAAAPSDGGGGCECGCC